MDRRLKAVAIIVGAFAVVVLCLAGYFLWRSIAYVDTFHARVMGDSSAVTAPAAGRVLSCDVQAGDAVREGQQVAVIEVYASGGDVERVAIPLRAPASGIVAQVAADPKDAVTAGTELVTILSQDDLWVEANIDESRVAHVKVGQPVQVRVEALQISFAGTVEQVGAATTLALQPDGGRSSISTTANAEVPVRIAFDAAGYRLSPGMSVEVRIRVDPRAR